ncbi:hypothetical protein [Bradyrhizobium sp.]
MIAKGEAWMAIKDILLPLVGEPNACAACGTTKTVIGRPPCWVMMSR